jgi:hypothetical protein
LVLGREEAVNEALRQTLELQSVFLAAKPPKNESQDILEDPTAPLPRAKRPKTIGVLGAVGTQATSGVTALTGGRQKTTTGAGNETADL